MISQQVSHDVPLGPEMMENDDNSTVRKDRRKTR